MKANQFGTHSEQMLHALGYKTASERPECGNCKHHEYEVGGTSWSETIRYKCKKAGCAVTKSAICYEWEAR
jgi:hypothetical protein